MVIINIKRCSRCHLPKLKREFNKAARKSRAKDGLYPYCKGCKRKYQREHPHKQDPKYLAEWYQRHRVAQDQKVRELIRRLRNRILELYGNKCECCGEARHNFLTLEHKLGGGNKHRRGKAPYTFYKEVLDEGYRPDKYGVLCFNCNCSRGAYGYCCHPPVEAEHS